MADATGGSSSRGPAARRATAVSCWLCGIPLPQDQMMPDGGSACDDIRWYCRDTRACAERWTQALRRHGPPGLARQGARSQPPQPGRRSQPLPVPPARRQSHRRGARL